VEAWTSEDFPFFDLINEKLEINQPISEVHASLAAQVAPD
jgi:hypothetical protein